MIPLAITELSTDSWISSLMEPEMRGFGLQPGWVLVYTSAIVFVIRIFAGSIIHWLKPLPVLALASALAAAGLFMLSGAGGLALLAAATLYGVGKSFFWGTSLGCLFGTVPGRRGGDDQRHGGRRYAGRRHHRFGDAGRRAGSRDRGRAAGP